MSELFEACVVRARGPPDVDRLSAHKDVSSVEGARLLESQEFAIGGQVRGEVIDLARRFGQRVGTWAANLAGPRAVAHGDFRLDNMLFGEGPGAAPLAVVDWQTCSHGHPAADVAYFLGAGLLPDDRRREEQALLAHYHAELLGAGVLGYGLNALRGDYRRYSFSGLVMAVVASQIVEVSDRGDAMFAAIECSLPKVRERGFEDSETYLEQLRAILKQHRDTDNHPVRLKAQNLARKAFRILPEQLQLPIRRTVQKVRIRRLQEYTSDKS